MRSGTVATIILAGLLAAGCSGVGQSDPMPAAVRHYNQSLADRPAVAADWSAAIEPADGGTSAVPTLSAVHAASWLAAVTAADSESNTPAAPAPAWSTRRGPAYPDSFARSLGRWAKEMPATLWDDTKATFTNPWSLAGFAAAAISGIAVNASGADYDVKNHYLAHREQLPDALDQIGDVGGNPATHFAVAGAALLTTMACNDVENYEKARTMLNALAINGVTTLALKGIVNSEAPNGDGFGWPSGHTSSSFCFATVVYEEYGPWVGVPALAFAGFVGYQRIDTSEHDLSDVISGALIGMAIGHAVANHHNQLFGMELIPYVSPNGGAGVALTKSW